MPAKKIGLTGGIGSGKSTVARCFAKLGVQVIDADAIGRELTAPGMPLLTEIARVFGDEVLDSDGNLRRKILGKMVFASADKRRALEAILHPPIRAEMHTRAARDSRPYCILDIPLLVESGQYREMTRVLVVDCAREVRMRRLQVKRGMTAAEIERVMANQADDAKRLAIADDVIDNGADSDDPEAAVALRVEELHGMYLEMFGPLTPP